MNATQHKTCLSIAGSDSGGEAGIQADLQCFNHFKVIGTTAITAVTAQNPSKVQSLNPTSSTALFEQLNSINDFFNVNTAKTGLLASAEQVEIVADFIEKNQSQLIVDPLIETTSGKKILDTQALKIFTEKLLPQAHFICPNIPEAEILSAKTITDETSLLNAGRYLSNKFKSHIYLKGGHSADSPGTDYLFTDNKCYKISTQNIDIKTSHGTGCRISASIAANLAKGETPLQSAINAKEYVLNCLLSAILTTNNQWIMPAQPQWQKQEFQINEIDA